MGRTLEAIQRTLMLPGGNIDISGAYATPLKATGGGLAIAANTANQALTVALAGNFAYLTDIWIAVTASAAVANSFQILDASGGTVLWTLPLLAGLTAGTIIPVHFSAPLRIAAAGGQFFVTTTGVGVTWAAAVNGYYDSALGN